MTTVRKAMPPRVKDVTAYWVDRPPAPSARCLAWLDRIESGWRRNRRIKSMGYHESAEYFGVCIWEWLNVLRPALGSWVVDGGVALAEYQETRRQWRELIDRLSGRPPWVAEMAEQIREGVEEDVFQELLEAAKEVE